MEPLQLLPSLRSSGIQLLRICRDFRVGVAFFVADAKTHPHVSRKRKTHRMLDRRVRKVVRHLSTFHQLRQQERVFTASRQRIEQLSERKRRVPTNRETRSIQVHQPPCAIEPTLLHSVVLQRLSSAHCRADIGGKPELKTRIGWILVGGECQLPQTLRIEYAIAIRKQHHSASRLLNAPVARDRDSRM